MKIFSVFLLCHLITFQLASQPLITELPEKEINGDWISFEVDNLNNYYLLSSSNQLRKYDSKGDSVAIYNDQRQFGTIGQIDVSNPLRILIYYPEYSTIVWVDRFLRPVHTLDLREAGILLSKAVATSFDGQAWVYDELERRLKKLGMKGELLLQTPDLRQVLGDDINPVSIAEEGQRIFCYDSLRGVYVFDYFGNFEKQIQVIGWRDWRVKNGEFLGWKDNSWWTFQISTGALKKIEVPGYIVQCQRASSGKLYILRADKTGKGASFQIFSGIQGQN